MKHKLLKHVCKKESNLKTIGKIKDRIILLKGKKTFIKNDKIC